MKLVVILILILLSPTKVQAEEVKNKPNSFTDFKVETMTNKYKTVDYNVLKLKDIDGFGDRLKSNVYSIDIGGSGFTGEIKCSFKNLNGESNTSIYRFNDGVFYPLVSKADGSEIHTIIRLDGEENLILMVLKDTYFKETYSFRDEYYYEGLKSSLESNLLRKDEIKKIGSAANTNDIRRILNVDLEVLRYRDIKAILENKTGKKYDFKDLNEYLFKVYRNKIDFLSDDEVLFEDLLLIKWDICV